jgi:hypothetical protein
MSDAPLDLDEDAEARYRAAQDRVLQAHAEWLDAGRPLTQVYPNGMVGISLLLKVLQDAERHAHLLLKDLRRGVVGRPVGYNTAPDRGPARRSKLRAVEGKAS